MPFMLETTFKCSLCELPDIVNERPKERKKEKLFAIISLGLTIHPKSFQINLLGLVDVDDGNGDDDKNENEFTKQTNKHTRIHT
jgi:hypothetical protein